MESFSTKTNFDILTERVIEAYINVITGFDYLPGDYTIDEVTFSTVIERFDISGDTISAIRRQLNECIKASRRETKEIPVYSEEEGDF